MSNFCFWELKPERVLSVVNKVSSFKAYGAMAEAWNGKKECEFGSK